jgi:hypothetical protein
VVIAFEQFNVTGEPIPDQRTKFAMEVDLYGNAYPSVDDMSPLPKEMLSGSTETAFSEITTCRQVITESVQRKCVNPGYNFEYRTGVKPAASTTWKTQPKGADLMRWKRQYIHIKPPVGGTGMSDPLVNPEHMRFVVYMYPKKPASTYTGPVLTHFVDGIEFQRGKYPTKWSETSTVHFGPTTDYDDTGTEREVVEPLNENIPYQMR